MAFRVPANWGGGDNGDSGDKSNTSTQVHLLAVAIGWRQNGDISGPRLSNRRRHNPTRHLSPLCRHSSGDKIVEIDQSVAANVAAVAVVASGGSSGGHEAPSPEVDWRDLFEERAAIREFDGRYSRAEAEALAWGELQNRWHLEHGDRIPRDLCAGCRRPIGDAEALDLIDGSRVHLTDTNTCLIQHGNRWRANATRALMAVGLRPHPTKEQTKVV